MRIKKRGDMTGKRPNNFDGNETKEKTMNEFGLPA